jgi:hypothetical protein
MKTMVFLPRKFWVRINGLLHREEVKCTHQDDLKDNPEIRKTLVDLVFFDEVLN